MAHKNPDNWSPIKERAGWRKGAPKRTPSAQIGDSHKKPETVYSVEEANDRLFDIFRNHDMSWVTHEQRRKLAEFYVLLMETQKVHNFTRLTSLKDVAIKHFIDCLIVAKLTELVFPLLDMGTGPGFPGIPLKILSPDQRIILAEGVQKRVEFLKTARAQLRLPHLDIIGRNIDPRFEYPVAGVITRAVEDARNTLRNTAMCLPVGGRVYLMKGPGVDPELPVAKAEMGEFFELAEDHRYILPRTTQERRLLVYRKIKPMTEEWIAKWAPEEDL